MKRGLLLLLAFALGAVPVILLSKTTYASNFRSGTNVVVQRNETVDHTLFAIGSNVEIDGTVNGDVFCAGQNITIDATVNGDVLCAGMNIQVSGKVSGSVRVAGQAVTVSASVGHNASLIGNVVHTDSDSAITSDLQAVGNDVTLNGSVGRDADIAGSTVAIDGTIGRDTQVSTNSLGLQSNAVIRGSLTYYSNDDLTRDSGAQVMGTVTKKQPQQRPHVRQTNQVLNIALSFFMLLALGFVLVALFPRHLNSLTDLGLRNPFMTLAIGLAACIGIPILAIVSFLTVIGAFVGVVLLFGWIVVMILSFVFTSYYAGRLVLIRISAHPFVVMLIGVVVLSILLLIPIIDILTYIATALLGGGMVIRYLFKTMPKPSYEAVRHPKHASKGSK